MQLIKTASSQSTYTAQTVPSAESPYSKAYKQQSHLLRELHLQHTQRKHLQQALIRKTSQLSIVTSESANSSLQAQSQSLSLSTKLLKRQVESLAYHAKACEGTIARLRSQLDQNVVGAERGDLNKDERQISRSLLSASLDMFDFEVDIGWLGTSEDHADAALGQELAGELEQAGFGGPGESAGECPVRFVPANGWENVLGTWI